MSRPEREEAAINSIMNGFPYIKRTSYTNSSALIDERGYVLFFVDAWNQASEYNGEYVGDKYEIREDLLDQFAEKVRRLTMMELTETPYPPRDRAKHEWSVVITDIRQDKHLRTQYGFGDTELQARTMALWGASWWIVERDPVFFKQQVQDLLSLKSDPVAYTARVLKFNKECTCRFRPLEEENEELFTG